MTTIIIYNNQQVSGGGTGGTGWAGSYKAEVAIFPNVRRHQWGGKHSLPNYEEDE